MPADVLAVLLAGHPVGRIERDARGALRFRYDDIDTVQTPLSVSMPPAVPGYGDARITPWLWGLLPDNADVLAHWGRRFGVSVASPYPLLATPVGRDCPGAVQFCPPGELRELLGRGGDVTFLSGAQVAQRLRALRADATSWLGPDFSGRFSLAGAQAKTALYLSGGSWGVPAGTAATSHILKPPPAGFDRLDLNEHLCLRAAAIAGLHAARSRIMTFEDETAIVVERFDRVRAGDGLTRVHTEDLCQALGVPPARKYQSDGGPSPGRIAELLRASVAGPEAETDVWRFADALAFNWLIGGTDAHAKNYSLLLSGTRVRLAPLYDVASMLPYDASKTHKLALAMKVGGNYRLPRTDRRSAWERTADELHLDRERLIRRVLDLAGRLPAAFEQASADDEVAAANSDLPQRLLDLVAARAARCATILGEPQPDAGTGAASPVSGSRPGASRPHRR